MSPEIKRIDIAEFRELGFLQEANRRFFHPLGLALEIHVDDDGAETLGGVWDYRDDEEGMIFGQDVDPVKVANVDAELEKHRAARIELMGEVVEPLGWTYVPPLVPGPSAAEVLERQAAEELEG